MWANMITKTKQGKVFCEFRYHLMNIPEDYDDKVEHLNRYPDMTLEPKEGDQLSSSNTGI